MRFDRADQRLNGRFGIGGQITQGDLESMEGPFDRNHADFIGWVIQIVVVREKADQVIGADRKQLGFDIVHGFGDLRLKTVLLGMLQHQVVGRADDGRIQHDERIPVQFGQSDNFFADQRVARTDDSLIAAGIQRDGCNVLFAFEFGIESDRDVVNAFPEIVGNVLQQHLVQIQFDQRVFFPERRDDGKERLDIRHRRILDRQASHLVGLEIAHLLLHAFVLLPEDHCLIVEKLPGFGRLDRRLFAVDQLALERVLQRSDRLADGRLRHIVPLGCFRETAAVHQVDVVFDFFDVDAVRLQSKILLFVK